MNPLNELLGPREIRKMIQVKAGDLIAIQNENRYTYAFVVTKIKHFGGNIIYGFHRSTEELIESDDLLSGDTSGFLAFIDLISAKRDGLISKIGKKIELPYANDPKIYRQAWPIKGSKGYNIRIFGEDSNMIEEYKVSSKDEITNEVLNLPEYQCEPIENFFNHVSRKWHQSNIETIWPNK